MAPGASPRQPARYFRTTRPICMVLVVAGMSYFGWAVFAPSQIRYDILGPLGRLTKYLVENHKTAFQIGYLVAWAAHIVEAFVSLWLCKIKGITDSLTQFLWFTQTLLFGIGSLYFLLVYKPEKKSH